MQRIKNFRNYEYDLRIGQWTGDFPATFRAHHPMRIPNQRHMLVNCETVDKDPLSEDLSVISGCGTDLGVDFQNQYGVVTTRSRFSQYYHPELDQGGKPVVIVRKYVGNANEYGKFPSCFIKWDKNRLNLATRRAPVTGQTSNMLRYLALGPHYSIHRKYSKFGPSRINAFSLTYGPENVIIVSNRIAFCKNNPYI